MIRAKIGNVNVGAFLLIADYIVTAAISALSAFRYLGVNHPEIFAAAAILGIGALNYFGPRHTGGLAFLISVPTAIVVVILGIFCIPHLGQAIHNLKPLAGGFFGNWNGFVGIVLALSGVEAIANATSVMKLDPTYVILGKPERNMIANILRGSLIRNVSSILPEEIHLLVHAVAAESSGYAGTFRCFSKNAQVAATSDWAMFTLV